MQGKAVAAAWGSGLLRQSQVGGPAAGVAVEVGVADVGAGADVAAAGGGGDAGVDGVGGDGGGEGNRDRTARS